MAELQGGKILALWPVPETGGLQSCYPIFQGQPLDQKLNAGLSKKRTRREDHDSGATRTRETDKDRERQPRSRFAKVWARNGNFKFGKLFIRIIVSASVMKRLQLQEQILKSKNDSNFQELNQVSRKERLAHLLAMDQHYERGKQRP